MEYISFIVFRSFDALFSFTSQPGNKSIISSRTLIAVVAVTIVAVSAVLKEVGSSGMFRISVACRQVSFSFIVLHIITLLVAIVVHTFCHSMGVLWRGRHGRPYG